MDVAQKIVDELFRVGEANEAKRLVLETFADKDGGGWSKGPVRDVINQHLRDAAEFFKKSSKSPKKGKAKNRR